MFHLQTDPDGVHEKGHWGYCNDDCEDYYYEAYTFDD